MPLSERLRVCRFLRAASAVLVVLCLSCLTCGGAAANCGYGPNMCPASYFPRSPVTPCTTCDTSGCCEVGFTFSTLTPNPNLSPAARWQFCSANVGSQLLVIGGSTVYSFDATTGYLNDVWATSTGTSWAQRTPAGGFSARAFFGCPVLGTTLFVIAGYNGADLADVWSSTDIGASFTQVTGAAAFGPRDSFGSVAFNNALYVIAGYSDPSNYYNDIWTSTTSGTTWTQVTPIGAIFSPRQGFGMVVAFGKIWLVGGESINTVFSEVWTSSTGASWTNVPQKVPIQPRTYGDLAAFDQFNQILLYAGGSATVFTAFANVSYADVFASYDGSTWTTTTPLPEPSQGGDFGKVGYTGLVIGGVNGATISSAQYTPVVGATCAASGITCPPVYASVNPYTLCSGATCSQEDCCTNSLGARSTKIAAIVLAVLCSTYTPVTLVQKIEVLTGVPAQSQAVTFFSCSSLTVYIAVVGTTPALADAALALIVQAALTGLLGPVVSVTLVDVPFPPPTPAPAYPEYPTIPIFRPPSTSNPALLALLTLLVIPLAICLGLICSHARRPQCMVPVSCAPSPIVPVCASF